MLPLGPLEWAGVRQIQSGRPRIKREKKFSDNRFDVGNGRNPRCLAAGPRLEEKGDLFIFFLELVLSLSSDAQPEIISGGWPPVRAARGARGTRMRPTGSGLGIAQAASVTSTCQWPLPPGTGGAGHGEFAGEPAVSNHPH